MTRVGVPRSAERLRDGRRIDMVLYDALADEVRAEDLRLEATNDPGLDAAAG
jgi:hypothetical protein